MPITMDGTDDMIELEHMIDQYGLYALTDALTTITFEKAEHLRTHWQDERAATGWNKASRKFGLLAAQLRKIQAA